MITTDHVMSCDLQDDMKKVDKAKKKLSGARLDMDAAKNRSAGMYLFRRH